MVSRILLLLILTSSVWGQDEMNRTQSSYEAVENHSVTLEWTSTIKTQIQNCDIYCDRFVDRWSQPLFHMKKGVQIPDHLDPDFAGRVQLDEDALREGRVRLSVSRLRTEDSGLYRCKVDTDHGFVFGTSPLSVSAAASETQTPRPGPEGPGPEGPGPEGPGPEGPGPEGPGPERPGPKRPKQRRPGPESVNKASRVSCLQFGIFILLLLFL